jgi:DNA polymerase bacteriophage-type
LKEQRVKQSKRMLEIRQELSRTSVKKYTAMSEVVFEGSRVRGLLQFYGANRTGRWAGRLVQVQSLPKNYLETLSHARECVKARKIDTLKLVYGNISDTLSQLIRTAFIPSDGHTFLVADFSVIEARVIVWLAGEQWRLEAAGYQTFMHVHDKCILDVPKDKADLMAVTDIIDYPTVWAPGLVLKAEGYETVFYKKE